MCVYCSCSEYQLLLHEGTLQLEAYKILEHHGSLRHIPGIYDEHSDYICSLTVCKNNYYYIGISVSFSDDHLSVQFSAVDRDGYLYRRVQPRPPPLRSSVRVYWRRGLYGAERRQSFCIQREFILSRLCLWRARGHRCSRHIGSRLANHWSL